MKKTSLSISLAGLDLANPTMLASGILGYAAETFETVQQGGAGAIVTKSIAVKPNEGYSNPTIVQVSSGLVNAMGLPNPGMKAFVKEIQAAKTVLHIPLIVSVYGFSAKEYATAANMATEAGADAVELNVSCPHVKHTGSEIGQNPEVLTEIVSEVKTSAEKPVFVKLTPNVTDISEVAEAAEKAGADGLTIMNTAKAMVIDVETMIPVLANKVGGLSGPAVKPIALRQVFDAFEHVRVPIIGCGGVTNWQDAVEFLLAGASAVQIGTAVATEGPAVFRRVAQGISSCLTKKRVRNVKELVGLAHRR